MAIGQRRVTDRAHSHAMLTLLLIFLFVALMVLAPLIGAESRPGFDERPDGRFGALR